MECKKCDYYHEGYMFNSCSLAEQECFMPLNSCALVNDDGTINFEDEYFKDSCNNIDEMD